MLSKEERDNLEIDGRIYLCYDYLFAIANDRILATHGGNISLISDKAEIICTYESIMVPSIEVNEHYDEDKEIYCTDSTYIDDYLIFIDNGKWGVMDYNGEVLVDAIYSSIEFDTNGKICVMP